MIDNKNKIENEEKAVLVGVVNKEQTEQQVLEYLDELAFLAETAGAITVKRFTQKLAHPDSRTFVGKGKLEEIGKYVKDKDIRIVIFDDELSGSQIRNIEKILECRVLDRNNLILDIFANRARTAQAKTQVELAQYRYLLPRLTRMWTHLEKQRGGIGMRGPGEQEIETDRRIVKEKISLLKKKLEKIDLQNITQRKNRDEMIRVSLVGYTNVGKSTLMNVLSKSDLFAENKLFATLDTTVRKVVWDAMPFLLSDTVGFIRKLPHHLIESFKSTLDEVRESDILLHVVDISHPQYTDQIETVNKTLKDLGAGDKQMILVCNKMDAYRNIHFDALLDDETKKELEEELHQKLEKSFARSVLFISAKSQENLNTLKLLMKEAISKQYLIRYPYRSKTW